MRSQTWIMAGATVVAAGVLMLGMAYATSSVALAGGQLPPCDATPTVFVDSLESLSVRDTAPDFQAASQRIPECTATSTRTPVRRLKTHTPTATPTEVPKTNTPVPPTATPTNTPKAASEAVSIQPPNTGSGDGASSGMTLWLLALGAASVAVGGSALLVGVRRRSV